VLNAIFYVLSTGCQWSALPSDLPPRSTVWAYLDLWDWDGTIRRIHETLYVQSREAAGREASPTTAIIDAQSARGALNVWPAPSASGFSVSGLICLHKRIRPSGEPLAKMESRASWSS